MKRTLLILAVVLAFSLSLPAQEKLTLTVPVSQPSVTDYQVDYIGISRASWTIVVQLHPSNTALPIVMCSWGSLSNNKGLVCSNGFTNAAAPVGFANAQALIVALNKANLSTAGNSLEARIYNRLIGDGAFSGSVTGSPQ